MSAKSDSIEAWEIVFKYPGKATSHWRAICTFIGNEREANAQAELLYAIDEAATDFMTTPLEDRP